MSEERPRDAAMADILASIRRIVAEEDSRFANSPLASLGDVLELTPEMRVDPPSDAEARRTAASRSAASSGAPSGAFPLAPPAARPPAPPVAAADAVRTARPEAATAPPPAEPRAAPPEVTAPPLSIDDAHIADIARAVVRQELAGAFGQTLTRNVKALIKDEVARALSAREPPTG